MQIAREHDQDLPEISSSPKFYSYLMATAEDEWLVTPYLFAMPI